MFLSLLGTAVGIGMVYGTLRTEIRMLKDSHSNFVTMADLRPLELDLREIKGMFRLTPIGDLVPEPRPREGN